MLVPRFDQGRIEHAVEPGIQEYFVPVFQRLSVFQKGLKIDLAGLRNHEIRKRAPNPPHRARKNAGGPVKSG
ncbi:MAG: hypothetical protein HGA19_16200 [Oscillochloris sp.]|nr:hypothetical protein [Oscillochloris sp.]